jgi:heat shock protein HslJ
MKANKKRPEKRDVCSLIAARSLPLLLTAAVLLALTGCADPADPLGEQDIVAQDRSDVVPAAAPQLEGRTWHLRSVRGVAVPAGVTITASFHDGRVTGKSGCNDYSAAYKADNGAIAFGPVGVTKVMCSVEVMHWENEFRAHLEEAAGYDVRDGQLLLFRPDAMALTFAPAARDGGDVRPREEADDEEARP